jgi:hypothetical protein
MQANGFSTRYAVGDGGAAASGCRATSGHRADALNPSSKPFWKE